MRATKQTIERVFREEYGRVLATLIRVLGDVELAEDALQGAFVEALSAWQQGGVPARPGAWLTTVARRDGTDAHRRLRKGPIVNVEEEPDVPLPAVEIDLDVIPDDQLRLIFTCCHPALEHASQVALTLRTLGGLTTAEVARAFLTSEETMAQRLVRA